MFSGHYIKNLWANFGKKVRLVLQKHQYSLQQKGQLNFVFDSESLLLLKNTEILKKFSSAPFLGFSVTVGKVRPKFGHRFFRPSFFPRPLLSFLAGILATWQHYC
jgi:hypothetical protein